MVDSPGRTADASHHGGSLADTLRDAAAWAAVALVLAVPLLALKTTDTAGGLALTSRWGDVARLVVFVFATKLILGLAAQRKGPPLLPAGVRDAMKHAAALVQAKEHWLFGALVGVAVLLPVLPFSDRYVMDLAVLVMTYVMLAWGLNIVVGLAGLLDLGYVAFYAVGAYSYAILAQTFGWSFWICLPLAGILAAFWGIILGFPVLRLRGDYLAIVTLAFGEIIRIVLLNWQSLTGGPNGISGIPRPSFFGLEFKASCDAGTFCGFFGIEHSALHRIVWLYYVIVALALITAWATTRLRRLPLGRAWEAMREDEIACRSLGLHITTVKLSAFSIGAMFGGFAGAFFATKQAFISPESFTFIESAMILAIVVLGGMGSQIGVAIAAIVMVGGAELFREAEQYRMLMFGLAMVAMMVWRPRGFVSTRKPTVVLGSAQAISGSLVKEGQA